ncbi:MAG: hypothetical protein DCC55_34855 [Chloroflexi bacterium]|nr:MAG: hypothetical protein DCC55_34855 [Chloroflexota bacterium]
MYFDYFPAGSSTPKRVKITEVELAKYIATDWMPGLPITIMNGFADVLRGVLETEEIQHHDYWCVNQDLASTDRQWKGMTSWILGVAFARFTVESEGYPWWSPVSAFKGDNSTGHTTTGNWIVSNPRSLFYVTRKPSWPSNLCPDYVLCRLAPTGYEYAFCESKGTDRALSRRNSPPVDWSNQVRSIDLLFNGKVIDVNHHLIVATRINPTASRPSTRQIIVRAWDATDPTNEGDDVKFASFLATHYAAICWRLGYGELAELMESAAIELAWYSTDNSTSWMRGWDPLRERFLSAYNFRFRNDLRRRPADVDGPTILQSDQAGTSFRLGDRLFELALTTEALDIMQAIVNFHPAELREVASRAVDRTRLWIDTLRSVDQQRIAVTLNGIAMIERG